jgi:hypothetical protein
MKSIIKFTKGVNHFTFWQSPEVFQFGFGYFWYEFGCEHVVFISFAFWQLTLFGVNTKNIEISKINCNFVYYENNN